MISKYSVITSHESTRFKEQFMEAQKRLAIAGNIVINMGGYIDQSTRIEIDYARSQGKTIEYLEEAYITAKLTEGIDNNNVLKRDLQRKLASVYNITSIGNYVGNAACAENVEL